MSRDRRSSERVRVWFEVLRAHPPLEGLARIADLSSEGARLHCDAPHPEPGQSIRVSVRIHDGEPLVLSGTVARSTSDGFAVAFDKASAEIHALLAAGPLGSAAEAESEPQTEARVDEPLPHLSGLTPIRQVGVTCHAENRWLAGRVCAPPLHYLLDHLNSGEPFFRLRDVTIPGQRETLPFIALRADAVDLLLPGPEVERIGPPQIGPCISRPLRVLLDGGVLEGQILVPEPERVSDFLMRCPPFLALHESRLQMTRQDGARFDPAPTPIAIVNLRRVIGVSDLNPEPAEDESREAL